MNLQTGPKSDPPGKMPPASPPVQQLRMLVIDDNIEICKNFVACATALGHHGGMATTEAEGKAMVKTGEWDVAVVDWWLQPGIRGGGGGGRVIAAAMDKGIRIPFALITGFSASEFKVMASLLEEFTNVIILQKPADPISVINVLRGMVARMGDDSENAVGEE